MLQAPGAIAIADIVPVSSDAAEARRQRHTRQRVAMLAGEHETYVIRRLRRMLPAARAAAIGPPDMSSNPFSAGCDALATLYDPTEEGESEPTVVHSDTTAVPAMVELLRASGLWTLSARIQRDAIGLREVLVRGDSDIVDGKPVVSWRTITPDLVEADPDPRQPSRPIEVRELLGAWSTQLARPVWVREVWSLRNGGRHAFVDENGIDVSLEHGLPKGGEVGDAYPLRREDGTPVLPYVVVHAASTGRLWDPFNGIEVVEGSITCSSHLTLYGHLLRGASWAQRYLIGGVIDGEVVDEGTDAERVQVVADPTVVLQVRGDGETSQPSAGQWAPPADPDAFLESVLKYERRLHAKQGLDPADAQRISGDPRSGYALKISSESKDRHALSYSPIFARSDAELVCLAAVLFNEAAAFTVVPETGWTVEHAPVRAILARRRREAAPQVLDLLDRVQQRRLAPDAAAGLLVELYGFKPGAAAALVAAVPVPVS